MRTHHFCMAAGCLIPKDTPKTDSPTLNTAEADSSSWVTMNGPSWS